MKTVIGPGARAGAHFLSSAVDAGAPAKSSVEASSAPPASFLTQRTALQQVQAEPYAMIAFAPLEYERDHLLRLPVNFISKSAVHEW